MYSTYINEKFNENFKFILCIINILIKTLNYLDRTLKTLNYLDFKCSV